jgi:hypothetical protein
MSTKVHRAAKKSMSPFDRLIRDALSTAGIRRGSRKFDDYELGKRALSDMALAPGQYERAVKILAGWVKI